MAVDVTKFWTNIGSSWDSFQDKETIENYWSSLAAGAERLHDLTFTTQLSKSLNLMEASYDSGPNGYYLVWSGLDSDLTVTPIVNRYTTIISPLVNNGGFEYSTSGVLNNWSSLFAGGGSAFTAVSGIFYSGTYSAQLNVGSSFFSYVYATQDILTIGTAYRCRLKAKTNLGTNKLLIGNGPGEDNLPVSLTNTWEEYTREFVADSATFRIGLTTLVGSVDSNTVYVDDIVLESVAGSFEFKIEDWIYSIPEIKYSYKYNGNLYEGTYTEGIDYIVSGLSFVSWGATPPTPDLRFSDKSVLVGYAPHVYRINPMLMNTWARFCGLKLTDFAYYNHYGNGQYEHLKTLIWALVYYQLQPPSLRTLKNAYAIARGLPFTRKAGICTSVTYIPSSSQYNSIIGGLVYEIPDTLLPPQVGQTFDMFELITDKSAPEFKIEDYKSNPSFILSHVDKFSARNTIIYSAAPAFSTIPYSTEFLLKYITKIMPSQIQFLLTAPYNTSWASWGDLVAFSTLTGIYSDYL